MIVPMKKITVVVQAKDADSAVARLRHLGVLHVEHQQMPKGKDIDTFSKEIAGISEAIGILLDPEFSQRATQVQDKKIVAWHIICQHVIDLHKRLDQLQEYSRNMLQNINFWQAWGEFDPQEVKALAERKIFIRFYQLAIKEVDKFPQGLLVKKISTVKGIVNCVTISREETLVAFKEVGLPKMSLAKMRDRLAEDSRAMELIREELAKAVFYREGLARAKKSLEKDLEFQEALKGMGSAGALMYLSGYIPFDNVDMLMISAKKEKWGILISEPREEDNIPTLIRNPKWISLVSPLFKLLEVVPGYRELDISLPFLIFFGIFFGMIIGDAGYGIIYLLLTFWAQRKYGKKLADKSVFYLFYVLSFCAILWGFLTGTFFGQEWVFKLGLKPLVPALNQTNTILGFCFFLGALHLTIAHSWRMILKLPSPTAWADAGWICILWSAFLLAEVLILGNSFPAIGKWLIITGILAVIFFTSPQKNIFKAIGAGLGALALSLMNNFTDVVSYMRLFAVGLAGVAIANTFNSLAAGVGRGNIFAIFLSLIIILAGHGLNLLLGPMSVLVHGIRLNVLEFCGHVDVKWSGFAYKPLKE